MKKRGRPVNAHDRYQLKVKGKAVSKSGSQTAVRKDQKRARKRGIFGTVIDTKK